MMKKKKKKKIMHAFRSYHRRWILSYVILVPNKLPLFYKLTQQSLNLLSLGTTCYKRTRSIQRDPQRTQPVSSLTRPCPPGHLSDELGHCCGPATEQRGDTIRTGKQGKRGYYTASAAVERSHHQPRDCDGPINPADDTMHFRFFSKMHHLSSQNC